MADITMCGNADECPVKHQCRRFLAKASDWQAWCDFYRPGETCENFYPF